ncbi:alpha/beta hydrolase [Vibrio parahaemolyticus]|uniref:alpha/beta fold hydrolase n=2 Tax=Vibrio parahaemolyticus TaxID=670 RepID=UPI00040226BA|nr:alpha/beta hydrolase [Vibrio parahaemolyticus]EGQ8033533.1 alpha/beta hydrolase [Vibrio parahaemolyticus]EGQ8923459.1 alpha/beta fold hydrolase [Vibrio parahaemolyticus]EGR2860682.1 alpha/beta hydrolase [Vibrio parahaemolyticus]EGR2948564.1 alpha/beta hydrolase [Vibrio parahaemolyticus]EGR3067777.1 alpha/beta hydrolase [Vibrio parahaemolyticus]
MNTDMSHLGREFQVINGDITIQAYEKGQGEPIIFVHGFPDSANAWRHQVDPFVSAGYRVITLDMRGYGKTSKPMEKEHYHITMLASDVKAVLDHLNIEKAHVVGHDWGAVVSWAFAGIYPQATKSLTAISVGHPLVLLSMPDIQQREMSWYFFFFQLPMAQDLLAADDWKLFKEWIRNHPEWEHWKESFKEGKDIVPAINWYRNALNLESPMNAEDLGLVQAPCLGIWSEQDYYLGEKQMKDSAHFIGEDGSFEFTRVNDATHWVQLDKPDEINEIVLNFTEKHR